MKNAPAAVDRRGWRAARLLTSTLTVPSATSASAGCWTGNRCGRHVLRLGLVLAGRLLGHQHDPACGQLPSRLPEPHRLWAPHEQRDHHVRKTTTSRRGSSGSADGIRGKNGVSSIGLTLLMPTWGLIDKTQGHRENQFHRFSAVPHRARQARSGTGLGRSRTPTSGGVLVDRRFVDNDFCTPSWLGNSNIVSSSASSRMERRAACAGLAVQRLAGDGHATPPGGISSSTPSMLSNFWYCLTSAFLGSVRIWIMASSVQLTQGGDHRHAADQLGDDAELDQVLRLDLAEEFGRPCGRPCSGLRRRSRCRT